MGNVRDRRGPLWFALALLALPPLAGCSTVTSVDVTRADETSRKGAYLNYAVAKSVFTIQIAAANSTAPTTSSTTTTTGAAAPAAAPAAAAPAAPAAAPAAPAAAAPAVAPAAPAAAPAAPAAPAAAPAPAAPTTSTAVDASHCAALTARYTAAQTEVAGEITTYVNLTQRLTAFSVGSPQAKDTPKQLAADIQAYQDVVQNGAYIQMLTHIAGTSAMNGPKPPGLWDQIVQSCQPRLTVTPQQAIVPDTARTFALKPQTNILYDDSLSFGVDTNGLLTNAAPTSTSEVTAIASAIASDVGMAVMPVKATVPPAAPMAAGARCDTRAGSLDDALDQLGMCDLAKPDDAKNAGVLALVILPQLSDPGSLENLPASTLPRTVYVSLDDFDENGVVKDGVDPSATIKLLANQFGLSLKLDCSGRKPSGETRADGDPENVKQPIAAKGVYDGIVVSASRSCRLRAVQKRGGETLLVTQNYFWAQDSRDLMILPTSRGFLVKRSVGYTFASGQATGVTDSRPSEALAIVSFPGTVIGSFVGGLASGATNRSAKTGAMTTELTAQTTNLTAQTNYLTAQAQLKKAQSDAAAPQ